MDAHTAEHNNQVPNIRAIRRYIIDNLHKDRSLTPLRDLLVSQYGDNILGTLLDTEISIEKGKDPNQYKVTILGEEIYFDLGEGDDTPIIICDASRRKLAQALAVLTMFSPMAGNKDEYEISAVAQEAYDLGIGSIKLEDCSDPVRLFFRKWQEMIRRGASNSIGGLTDEELEISITFYMGMFLLSLNKPWYEAYVKDEKYVGERCNMDGAAACTLLESNEILYSDPYLFYALPHEFTHVLQAARIRTYTAGTSNVDFAGVRIQFVGPYDHMVPIGEDHYHINFNNEGYMETFASLFSIIVQYRVLLMQGGTRDYKEWVLKNGTDYFHDSVSVNLALAIAEKINTSPQILHELMVAEQATDIKKICEILGRIGIEERYLIQDELGPFEYAQVNLWRNNYPNNAEIRGLAVLSILTTAYKRTMLQNPSNPIPDLNLYMTEQFGSPISFQSGEQVDRFLPEVYLYEGDNTRFVDFSLGRKLDPSVKTGILLIPRSMQPHDIADVLRIYVSAQVERSKKNPVSGFSDMHTHKYTETKIGASPAISIAFSHKSGSDLELRITDVSLPGSPRYEVIEIGNFQKKLNALVIAITYKLLELGYDAINAASLGIQESDMPDLTTLDEIFATEENQSSPLVTLMELWYASRVDLYTALGLLSSLIGPTNLNNESHAYSSADFVRGLDIIFRVFSIVPEIPLPTTSVQ